VEKIIYDFIVVTAMW